MAEEKKEQGRMEDGAWLVLGAAGVLAAAGMAKQAGYLPEMPGFGGGSPAKAKSGGSSSKKAPKKKRAPAKKKPKAKAKSGSPSKKGKSAWQGFVSRKMPGMRKKGLSAGDAMKAIAAEWRAQKG